MKGLLYGIIHEVKEKGEQRWPLRSGGRRRSRQRMTIDELVNKYYENLNENDLHIWNFISKHKKRCSTMTIEELTTHCNVSKTSIIRFAKKISLSGFSELKVYMKMDASSESKQGSSQLDILCNGYIHAIEELKARNMDAIFRILHQANRVFLFGSGSVQINVCKEIYRLFFNGGDYYYYFDNKYDFTDILYNLHEDDVMIIISLNGESETVVNLAKQLNMKNIKVISITKMKNNTLASISDESIYFSNTDFSLPGENGRTFQSTTMMFILVEIVYVKYQIYKNALLTQRDAPAT